jgi:hypothetical protein
MAKLDVPAVSIAAAHNVPMQVRDGAPAATATPADFTVAEQTVFLDAARPSYITLPVIPR